MSPAEIARARAEFEIARHATGPRDEMTSWASEWGDALLAAAAEFADVRHDLGRQVDINHELLNEPAARLTDEHLRELADDAFTVCNWAWRNRLKRERQIDELVRTFEVRLGYRMAGEPRTDLPTFHCPNWPRCDCPEGTVAPDCPGLEARRS